MMCQSAQGIMYKVKILIWTLFFYQAIGHLTGDLSVFSVSFCPFLLLNSSSQNLDNLKLDWLEFAWWMLCEVSYFDWMFASKFAKYLYV